MNRDVYSIILGKAKHVLEVTLQNAHNKWERAYIHEDVVKGFMCCKCVMLCTRNAHPDPQRRQHLIVDSWERLLDIHHPDNLYRVTPIKSSGVNAFLASLAICTQPGSPFQLDHRVDHIAYRCTFSYKSPVRAAVESFLREDEKIRVDGGNLPFHQMEFDCVLRAPKDAGLLVVKPTINPATINNMAMMMRFADSKWFFENTGLDPVPWKEINPLVRKRHMFLAAETMVPVNMQKQLIEAARMHNIFLFHKKGLSFHFLGVPQQQQ